MEPRLVIAGRAIAQGDFARVDPAIHLFKKFAKKMDARVEPGHDEST